MRGRDSRLPLITPPLQLPPSPVSPTNSRVKIPGRQKVFHILGRGKNGPRERERWASCSTRIAAGPKSERVANCWTEQFLMKCFSNIVNWVSPEQASCCTRISGQTQFRKGRQATLKMHCHLCSGCLPLYICVPLRVFVCLWMYIDIVPSAPVPLLQYLCSSTSDD